MTTFWHRQIVQKWQYRLPGALIAFVALLGAFHRIVLPIWLPVSWFLAAGFIVLLLDVVWAILDCEILPYTPIWEILGMCAGFVVIIWGFIKLFDAFRSDSQWSHLIAVGIVLLGAALMRVTEALKNWLGAKIDRL